MNKVKAKIAKNDDDDNLLQTIQFAEGTSLYQHFGPCGRISNFSLTRRSNLSPGYERLLWNRMPTTVLVLKKFIDVSVIPSFIQLITWLLKEKKMLVFLEHSVIVDSVLTTNPGFIKIRNKIMFFDVGMDDLTDKIDFVVCLGGDSTVLYTSRLFQKSVPPIIAFHMDSLGFLTPFKFTNFQQKINYVLNGNASVMLRTRLECTIFKKNGNRHDPLPKILVLNDVVIDRGPSPYLSNLDLFLDGKQITSVQGDGLIISTPTGSTAYAVAAGASIVHPSITAMMITPICPHSLSFRPIVIPTGMEFKISLSSNTRSNAWISFDGRNQQELCKGDSLRVITSMYPVPSVCADDQMSDWFNSLSACLHWNERKRQNGYEDPNDLV